MEKTPFIKTIQPNWINEAEKTVHVQSMMQNRSPALLSTMEYEGKHFMVQEIQPTKDKINFKLLRKEYREMIRVISDMAMLTASAQLRSSGRMGSATAQQLMEFGNRQDWQEEVLRYSSSYSHIIQDYFRDFTAEYNRTLRQRA